MKKYPGFGILLFPVLLVMISSIAPNDARALTVNEVVVDLACPCECPLVLADCNMSCGLKWKNDVGKLINQGMSKQEIIDHFVAKHGDAARITPLQRVRGKIFQYTRSFGALDWTVLWAGLAIWVLLMLIGIYTGIKKLFFNTSQTS